MSETIISVGSKLDQALNFLKQKKDKQELEELRDDFFRNNASRQVIKNKNIVFWFGSNDLRLTKFFIRYYQNFGNQGAMILDELIRLNPRGRKRFAQLARDCNYDTQLFFKKIQPRTYLNPKIQLGKHTWKRHINK